MKTVSIINEKNERFNSIKNYKSEGRFISVHEVKSLVDSGEFWSYNNFNMSVLSDNDDLVMMSDNNCIRRLTSRGYVTIALRTIKK